MQLTESPAEQTPQDDPLAKKWSKRIDLALKKDEERKKLFKKLRSFVRGDHGVVSNDDVRVNLIHSTFSAIIPQLYSKNPEIEVSPAQSIDERAYDVTQKLSQTMEIVLNAEMVDSAQLKKRIKSAIRAAMTTRIGWIKCSFQTIAVAEAEDAHGFGDDMPLLGNAIPDTRDNLALLDHTRGDVEEDHDDEDVADLNNQVESLSAQGEAGIAEGIVLDNVLAEDMFILDNSLNAFDDYQNAAAIAQRIWMTEEDYEVQFGQEAPASASRFSTSRAPDKNTSSDDDKMVAVFEIWDRKTNTVFTLAAGAKAWARDPWHPLTVGERWYPFFGLAFNPIDGSIEPVSDVELLMGLQEEYNFTRTMYREVRSESLPAIFYRKSGKVSDETLSAYKNRSGGIALIGIEGDTGAPVTNDIAPFMPPAVNPAVYDTAQIMRDIEMVSGAQDASRASVNKAKTATEAEIMANGLQSRLAERQDLVEDMVSEIAQYSAQMLLLNLTADQVKTIAGSGAVWPSFSREQAYQNLEIKIRAGSSGKPHAMQERENWMNLLPQLKEAIQQIAQLQNSGQLEMANIVRKLLEETLRRFDERIDINQFIPKPAAPPPQAAQGALNNPAQAPAMPNPLPMPTINPTPQGVMQ